MREKGLKSLYPGTTKISVGMATCGLSTGAGKVYEALQKEIEKSKGSDTAGKNRLHRFLSERACCRYFGAGKTKGLLSGCDP